MNDDCRRTRSRYTGRTGVTSRLQVAVTGFSIAEVGA